MERTEAARYARGPNIEVAYFCVLNTLNKKYICTLHNFYGGGGDWVRGALITKIAGRKRPALVDPSHKVGQGGKGSVWNGQTYRQTEGHIQFTSGPLPVHFRSLPVHFLATSSLLEHHRWSYEASQL